MDADAASTPQIVLQRDNAAAAALLPRIFLASILSSPALAHSSADFKVFLVVKAGANATASLAMHANAIGKTII